MRKTITILMVILMLSVLLIGCTSNEEDSLRESLYESMKEELEHVDELKNKVNVISDLIGLTLDDANLVLSRQDQGTFDVVKEYDIRHNFDEFSINIPNSAIYAQGTYNMYDFKTLYTLVALDDRIVALSGKLIGAPTVSQVLEKLNVTIDDPNLKGEIVDTVSLGLQDAKELRDSNYIRRIVFNYNNGSNFQLIVFNEKGKWEDGVVLSFAFVADEIAVKEKTIATFSQGELALQGKISKEEYIPVITLYNDGSFEFVCNNYSAMTTYVGSWGRKFDHTNAQYEYYCMVEYFKNSNGNNVPYGGEIRYDFSLLHCAITASATFVTDFGADVYGMTSVNSDTPFYVYVAGATYSSEPSVALKTTYLYSLIKEEFSMNASYSNFKDFSSLFELTDQNGDWYEIHFNANKGNETYEIYVWLNVEMKFSGDTLYNIKLNKIQGNDMRVLTSNLTYDDIASKKQLSLIKEEIGWGA